MPKQIISTKKEHKLLQNFTKVKVLKNVYVVVAVVVLSGCASSSPVEKCKNSATKDSQALRDSISILRQNISRGYALHEEQVPYTVQGTCYNYIQGPYGAISQPYSCPSTNYRTQSTPVPVNLNEERAKLAQYQKLLPQYTRRAVEGLAECRAKYPRSG